MQIFSCHDKINKNNRIQQVVIGFKQDTSKRMTQRLEMLGLSYTYLREQYDSAKSTEDFVKWLKSVGIKLKDSRSQSNMLPLLFFYDCESTGGSMYGDHIIEVRAKVVTAPGSADISQFEYGSLIHSSRTIVKAVQSKCGITARMLVTEPNFRHVFEELLSWISGTIKIVDKVYELQDINIIQY